MLPCVIRAREQSHDSDSSYCTGSDPDIWDMRKDSSIEILNKAHSRGRDQMLSQFFILSPRGDTIVFKDCIFIIMILLYSVVGVIVVGRSICTY